ncbi:MAG: hypothetical protein ACRC2R_09140 [Xenococcaceae cyanobacterium]
MPKIKELTPQALSQLAEHLEIEVDLLVSLFGDSSEAEVKNTY